MTECRFLYKCRLCNGIWGYTAKYSERNTEYIEYLGDIKGFSFPLCPPKKVHRCDDGNIGICDFVGVKPHYKTAEG